MADHGYRNYMLHPELAEIRIEGLMHGKFRHFDSWRRVVADMIGAPVRYELRDRAVWLQSDDPAVPPPQTLQLLEAVVIEPARMIEVTPEIRRGIWHETPDEPLWVLTLLTIPGGTFFARHAGAIAERLDEIDEIVHAVDLGGSTHFHEAARRWFRKQARSGGDVTVEGGFEPTGWWPFDLADVDPGQPLPAR